MVILLRIKEDVFVLESSKNTLHEAFGYLREALTDCWTIGIVEYGPDNSFWYNIRRVADNNLLYQIRVLA